jgi:hypothetical protein
MTSKNNKKVKEESLKAEKIAKNKKKTYQYK